MNKNYIPLYRKYRPQTIEQIVGQEHIKKALANAIQMDRISHAYLLPDLEVQVKLLLPEFLQSR